MITAQEAKELSEKINSEKNAAALQIIERDILHACNLGKRVVNLYSEPPSEVRKILEGSGYKFSNEHYNQRDGYSVTISW